MLIKFIRIAWRPQTGAGRGREDSMSREYPDQPLVGLGAIVWKDGRVLMVKRGRPPGEGIWSLPGGLQLVGETVAEGVRREIAEETGVGIELLGLVEVRSEERRGGKGWGRTGRS